MLDLKVYLANMFIIFWGYLLEKPWVVSLLLLFLNRSEDLPYHTFPAL